MRSDGGIFVPEEKRTPIWRRALAWWKARPRWQRLLAMLVIFVELGIIAAAAAYWLFPVWCFWRLLLTLNAIAFGVATFVVAMAIADAAGCL